MDAKKLTAALAEKMQAEQDKYRTWLLSQPPAEILNHTYEYTIRQDILIALEDHDLTAAQAETLLASSAPLADIYRDWCKRDDPQYMEDIQDTIEARADDLIQREEEIRKSPVYKYPFDYAKENGELDQYRASHQANIACKQAIENEISNRHDGFSFDCKAAVHAVVKKFGYDRTLYVLAATVRDKKHDGRFSYKNKDWARTIPVFEDADRIGGDRNRAFVVQSHPALVDGFVTTARHEYLLSLPLTKEDIKAEAVNILCKFQDAREPNSPSRTHYIAQISPDFLARAKTKDTDRLMAMLPFQSLSFSTLEGRRGTYALISQDENRFQKLQLRKPSVRKKLQEQSAAPKPPAKKKAKEQER